jgi:hypothetical protein
MDEEQRQLLVRRHCSHLRRCRGGQPVTPGPPRLTMKTGPGGLQNGSLLASALYRCSRTAASGCGIGISVMQHCVACDFQKARPTLHSYSSAGANVVARRAHRGATSTFGLDDGVSGRHAPVRARINILRRPSVAKFGAVSGPRARITRGCVARLAGCCAVPGRRRCFILYAAVKDWLRRIGLAHTLARYRYAGRPREAHDGQHGRGALGAHRPAGHENGFEQ